MFCGCGLNVFTPMTYHFLHNMLPPVIFFSAQYPYAPAVDLLKYNNPRGTCTKTTFLTRKWYGKHPQGIILCPI